MALVHSTSPSKEALRVDVNRAHCDPVFESASPYLENMGRDDGTGKYILTRTLLVNHVEKPENVVYGP